MKYENLEVKDGSLRNILIVSGETKKEVIEKVRCNIFDKGNVLIDHKDFKRKINTGRKVNYRVSEVDHFENDGKRRKKN